MNFHTVTSGLLTPGDVYNCVESDELSNQETWKKTCLKNMSGNMEKQGCICMPLVAQNGIAKVKIVSKHVSCHLKLFGNRGSPSFLIEPDFDMLGRAHKQKLKAPQCLHSNTHNKNKTCI